MKVWVLSTCVPGENEPCMPQVFVSEEAAKAAFVETMRNEWDSFIDWNNDVDPAWPDDAHKAHDIMAKASPSWGRWEITTHNLDIDAGLGNALKQTEALQEIIRAVKTARETLAAQQPGASDIADAIQQCDWSGVPIGNKTILRAACVALRTRPTYVPENDHGVKPGYYTRPDIVRLLRKHHTNPSAVHFIADMME